MVDIIVTLHSHSFSLDLVNVPIALIDRDSDELAGFFWGLRGRVRTLTATDRSDSIGERFSIRRYSALRLERGTHPPFAECAVAAIAISTS